LRRGFPIDARLFCPDDEVELRDRFPFRDGDFFSCALGVES
jgi:hypothetical protein